MPANPHRRQRRSIRLRGYDYTQPGVYFVTICTHQRIHLFGQVVAGSMQLSEYGNISDTHSAARFGNVDIGSTLCTMNAHSTQYGRISWTIRAGGRRTAIPWRGSWSA